MDINTLHMEENNNNNIIVKGLAIILIAILGLNVYRTETTKKEMSQLAETVQRLTAQVDSLGFIEAPSRTKAAVSTVSKKEFTNLSKSVSTLESKLSALQGSVDRLSNSKPQSVTVTNVSNSSTSGQSQNSGSSNVTSGASSSYSRVSVSAKVKVENRYVQGTTFLPNVSTGPTGIVVINVTMDQVGIVGAVSVNSNSTISDEEIIDLCKESALKTHFAFNPDAPSKSKGTITYSFTAK